MSMLSSHPIDTALRRLESIRKLKHPSAYLASSRLNCEITFFNRFERPKSLNPKTVTKTLDCHASSCLVHVSVCMISTLRQGNHDRELDLLVVRWRVIILRAPLLWFPPGPIRIGWWSFLSALALDTCTLALLAVCSCKLSRSKTWPESERVLNI